MRPATRTLTLSLATVAVMAGLVAASVPAYRLFCRATGLGGTAQAVAAPALAAVDPRTIRVRFDGSVNQGLAWRFAPTRTQVEVHLGETALATYTATNLGRAPVTGTAVFNVTPAKAGRYFNKIACFCFTAQTLAPDQTAELPVSFYVDPKIAEDPDTNDVHTITLSYTFYQARAAN